MKKCTQLSYRERILRVMLYIQNNMDVPLGFEELAKVACFSPFHFHKVFRGMVGESLAEHIRRIRLERAAHCLRYGKRSITDLALEAAYENTESFTRSFRNHFGVTPTQYRAQAKDMDPDRFSTDQERMERILFPGEITMDVMIQSFPSQQVAFVRHIGPYDKCCSAWASLCSWAGPKGLLGPDSKFLGLCYDDPETTPQDKIRYDACVALAPDVQPFETEHPVAVQEIAAGDYAVTLHTGPYSTLKDTYAQLCGRWLPSSGREIAFLPSIEVYLNDPEKTPPEKLKVEIRMPLQP